MPYMYNVLMLFISMYEWVLHVIIQRRIEENEECIYTILALIIGTVDIIIVLQ